MKTILITIAVKVDDSVGTDLCIETSDQFDGFTITSPYGLTEIDFDEDDDSTRFLKEANILSIVELHKNHLA